MDNKQIRRQYLCICDGKNQETLYFKHLSRLLKTENRSVTFTTAKNRDNIDSALRKTKHIQYDKAIVFDYDGKDEKFYKTLSKCVGGIIPAYSNRNFDLWLLLHKQDFNSSVTANDAYIKAVRTAFKLDDEADIKSENVIEKSILPKIELPDVKDAIRRVRKIREQKLPDDAKSVGKVVYYNNPDLLIHEFIATVFSECEESLE